MQILKPIIRGLKPFRTGEVSGTWTWADSVAEWADTDYMWAAQLETGEMPVIGDIRIDVATIKHD